MRLSEPDPGTDPSRLEAVPRFGRRKLPAAVGDVPLDAGERRLVWALTMTGEAVVATDLGLRLPGGSRIDWPDVERVSWQRPQLIVLGIAPVAGTGSQQQVELADDGGLPEVVRSQVTASIGWSRHHRLQPAGGVRIVGRRRPGRELLDWQVVYDPDTDPADAGRREQAEALLLDARRTIG